MSSATAMPSVTTPIRRRTCLCLNILTTRTQQGFRRFLNPVPPGALKHTKIYLVAGVRMRESDNCKIVLSEILKILAVLGEIYVPLPPGEITL